MDELISTRVRSEDCALLIILQLQSEEVSQVYYTLIIPGAPQPCILRRKTGRFVSQLERKL